MDLPGNKPTPASPETPTNSTPRLRALQVERNHDDDYDNDDEHYDDDSLTLSSSS